MVAGEVNGQTNQRSACFDGSGLAELRGGGWLPGWGGEVMVGLRD